ncbi:class I SAM-dependent methyltransferase [Leptospira sp. GIMC2001]|uniref:class I SAM-dependent methyltransferase n=1 Tax=Leptospira sp. GIMC2001 TaxID=1513297 RepID=UPI00234B2630|nr:class I SAM-dependent methyltransferase [Leptospira sp. GIMC2001]WCL51208.1 class I SAM-dependent methyltransferase [Leptospira sp. GIMC2001]
MSKQVLRHDTNCRVCASDKIKTVLKFKDTPLEDQFISKENLDRKQSAYPLELAICEHCGYLHLPHIVNPEESYNDYVYVSGVTVGLRGHYDDYASEIKNEFKIPENSFVVDLGSNDGSMLASFKKIHMRIQGVEPASSIARLANDSGLPTINNFFTESTVEEIIKNQGKADVVTANYMYANIDNVIEFTQNVTKLLSADGIFVVQTGYHPDQFKIKMFDYIYHEHFSYFSVDVIKNIFNKCGLELIHVKKISPKGGSIRVVAQLKGGRRSIDSSVEKILNEESKNQIKSSGYFQKFESELNDIKERLISSLDKLKSEGKKIIALGASHSTTTLLYHFELAKYIDYIVDDNELKHGKYSPGYHIPVYSTEKLYSDKPDYVLVLAWQHQGSIKAKHNRYIESGGHWIIPLPELVVI